MIYTKTLLENIKEKLNLLYFNGDKTELITYCPFCEGITGKRHGHLYISVNKPVFKCHRCEKSGNIIELIKELKLNININEAIDKNKTNNEINIGNYNNTISDNITTISSESNENDKNNKTKNKILKEPVISRDIVLNKIEYLEKRLNINNEQVLEIPRLILDLNYIYDKLPDFVLNNIHFYNKNYVGFLTNNNYLILRKITEENKLQRYYTIKLKNYINTITYYSINLNKISISTPDIFIAEGIFDILYTYFNKNLFNKMNAIMAISILGRSNYKKIFDNLPLITKVFRNNIYILSDSDVPLFFYDMILKNNPYVESYKVLYNINKKDWGE